LEIVEHQVQKGGGEFIKSGCGCWVWGCGFMRGDGGRDNVELGFIFVEIGLKCFDKGELVRVEEKGWVFRRYGIVWFKRELT
ncbi:hypothetical protein, partial [Bacillus subtilis]|uniref:hypothetical protein n=1 Tax=Bacillus subtilis TaxID=1423 RepID=UPI001BDB9DB4